MSIATWLDAMFGRVQKDAVDLELQGGLNFQSPITATPDPDNGRINIALGFTGEEPVAVSVGPSAYRSPLGMLLDEESLALANEGEAEFSITGLPANSRIKITVQADATTSGATYEIARRIIVHTGTSSVSAVSAYTIDTAIDGDVEAAWGDELELDAAAGTGLVVDLTLTNSTGSAVNAGVTAQVESRNAKTAPA